jgi:hypothetical protein
VYSDRTRGELQVAKNNFFCSEETQPLGLYGVETHVSRRSPWCI